MNPRISTALLLLCLSITSAHAQDTPPAFLPTPLHPEIVVGGQAPTRETHYIGGGIKKLRGQLAFPFSHPVKLANNCSYPVRHPLEAFGRFSKWVEPYNPGLSACSSVASVAGSVGVYGLFSRLHNPVNTTVVNP